MPTITDTTATNMFATIQSKSDEVAQFANKTSLSETEMIQFNMAASRYSNMVSLASNLVKNLTDTEKQVANKM